MRGEARRVTRVVISLDRWQCVALEEERRWASVGTVCKRITVKYSPGRCSEMGAVPLEARGGGALRACGPVDYAQGGAGEGVVTLNKGGSMGCDLDHGDGGGGCRSEGVARSG
jgi:hypothetical protein